MTRPAPKPLRCAIYTRVSTEHGLEQDFNSLHAQREAGEAYIKSQAHEGWRLVPDRYDDGGYSGGSMERPALQQLLADLRSGKIDTVVVYKVDRLTRSLTDFARLVELFDAHEVSFVSVTQSFNTTSSMGRLTLNVLLSFAQFEREVTGERIRDKIAASKRKGIWMGGVVPLGYRVVNRKLLVDDEEARLVRLIFERYLALGSLPALQRELREKGIVTRQRVLASGRSIGAVHLTNGPLAYILKNRIYLGEINHRHKSYPGEHEPIVEFALFDAVQAKMVGNRVARRSAWLRSDALLMGKLRDDRGNAMSPSYAIKSGVRYRYYVSQAVQQGRKGDAGSVPRVAATDIETLVLDTLKTMMSADDGTSRELIERAVETISVGKNAVTITVLPDAIPEGIPNPILVPWTPPSRARRREVIPLDGAAAAGSRPIRRESRSRLLYAIGQGRRWLDELVTGRIESTEALAAREDRSERSIRMTLSLAFLAPDIVKAAIDGTLSRGVGVSRLIDLPIDWSEQRQALGVQTIRPS
jgi:DNA invertase Pin-like site-specific DNA recombinase